MHTDIKKGKADRYRHTHAPADAAANAVLRGKALPDELAAGRQRLNRDLEERVGRILEDNHVRLGDAKVLRRVAMLSGDTFATTPGGTHRKNGTGTNEKQSRDRDD